MGRNKWAIKFLVLFITFVLIPALMCLLPGPLFGLGEKAEQSSADRTLAPYFFLPVGDAKLDQFPLEGMRFRARVVGIIARVEVTQVWKNRGQRPLEAVYVFPASTRAAVHDLEMKIGERTIRAEIAKREEARKTYEEARDSGRTASLLEQDRPNVFTMRVANILPGDRIEVRLTYSELLSATEGEYELVLPTVVGPRYSNQPAAGAKEKDKFVENPYLPAGLPAPYSLDIEAALKTGVPIAQVICPSHSIKVGKPSPDSATIRLEDHMGGNRDFILRYRLRGDTIQSGLLLYKGEKENFFLLLVEPPAQIQPADIPPREYIFVLDVSGSMAGEPLETAKDVMVRLVSGLRKTDTFNIVLFESETAVLAPQSLPATDKNISAGLRFIDEAPGGGGTEMAKALETALRLSYEADQSRSIIVCTDGYVDFEAEVFRLVRENLDRANLFAVGIGSSVNRFLIEGLARAGRGEPFLVTGPDGDFTERFKKYVSAPVLTDISVRFDGFSTQESTPLRIPDLFLARPLAVFGKWRAPLAGRIVVSGMTAKGLWEQRIAVSAEKESPDNAALRELWARERVAELEDMAFESEEDDKKAEAITELGLKYRLLTSYTSFVSVDTVPRTGQAPLQVRQPLPLPEGVPETAVGGPAVSGSGGSGVSYYSSSGSGGVGGVAGSGMSFSMVEMWQSVGMITKLAFLTILVSVIGALVTLISLFIKYFRLKKRLREQGRLIKASLSAGTKEATAAEDKIVASPEGKDAARFIGQELTGCGPLTRRILINEFFELRGSSTLRLTRRLNGLGIAFFLAGILGPLENIDLALRGIILAGSPGHATLIIIALMESMFIFKIGFIGGLSCLGAGFLGRNRIDRLRKKLLDSLFPFPVGEKGKNGK